MTDSPRFYHDSWEVHAGNSVHDDEDPGVGQVVKAVVKTNWKERWNGDKYGLIILHYLCCSMLLLTCLETWRPAAEGQNSMKTRLWAGALRQRRWWGCCFWRRRGPTGSRNDQSTERFYLRETHASGQSPEQKNPFKSVSQRFSIGKVALCKYMYMHTRLVLWLQLHWAI